MRRAVLCGYFLGLVLSATTTSAQPQHPRPAPPPGDAAETPAPPLEDAEDRREATPDATPSPQPPPTPPAPAPTAAPPPPPSGNDEGGPGAPSPTGEGATNDPQPVEAAPDLLTGHLRPAVLGLLGAPFGSLERHLPWTDVAAPGAGVGLDLTVGVSRAVALGVRGDLLRLGPGSRCDGCSTSSWAAAALVRYHLVQGMRFDPHVAFGTGLRWLATDGSDQDLDYLGLDWLRVTAGGDWYATPNLAFSPFVEVTAGTAVARPSPSPAALAPGEDRRSTSYGLVALGLRISLDAPGR